MQTGWLRYKCWQGQGYFHAVSQAASILFLPLTKLQSQLKPMEGPFVLRLEFTSLSHREVWRFRALHLLYTAVIAYRRSTGQVGGNLSWSGSNRQDPRLFHSTGCINLL